MSWRQRALSFAAERASSATDIRMKTRAIGRLTCPEGIARPLVRGFFASISASTSRLNPMAAVRAPTIARTM